MLRKRWNDKSKSADEILAMAVEPAQFKIEPEAKKQRQSTIKRLFGSVKKLLPSNRKPITKAQPQTKAVQLSAVPSPQLIEKSAAMQEAELFLERIGADWTVEQLRSRIDYLYKLVNDAFERAYILSVKENMIPCMSPASKDHMLEIRNLQRMISQRVPVIETTALQSPYDSTTEVVLPEPAIEIKRSNSVENCVSALPVLELPILESTPIAQPRFNPPSYIPVDLTQGLVYNGVENKVNFYCLPLDNRFHLTSSQIDVTPIELAKASASGSEHALDGLLAQLEGLEVTPATTQDIIDAAEASSLVQRKPIVGQIPVSRHSAQNLPFEREVQFGCEQNKSYSDLAKVERLIEGNVERLISVFEEHSQK